MYIKLTNIDTQEIIYEATNPEWTRYQLIYRHRLGLDNILGVIDYLLTDEDKEIELPKQLINLSNKSITIKLNNYEINLFNVEFNLDNKFHKIRFTGEEII